MRISDWSSDVCSSDLPHPFTGTLDGELSSDVKIEGMAAATKGSTATNSPSHVPIGGSFVNPPQNRAKVTVGSATVKINGRPAARLGDVAETCNDPQALPVGTRSDEHTYELPSLMRI